MAKGIRIIPKGEKPVFALDFIARTEENHRPINQPLNTDNDYLDIVNQLGQLESVTLLSEIPIPQQFN